MINNFSKNEIVKKYLQIFTSTFIYRLIIVIIGIILSRILSPKEAGLLAISYFMINIFKVFMNNGIGDAVIYEKKPNQNFLNTAHTSILIFSIIAYLLLYLIAPVISNFFKDKELTILIRLLSLFFIFSSIGKIPGKILEKNLLFKKKIIPEILSSFIFLFIVIFLAYNNYGIYSFIYGLLISILFENLYLFITNKTKLKIQFDYKIFKKIINYGHNIFLSSLIIYLLLNIDDFIIGKMLGLEILGFYAAAYIISNTPATQITHIANKLMFPLYSKRKSNLLNLKKTYLLNLELATIGSFFLTGIIFTFIPEMVNFILGEKWMPIILITRILCIGGMIRSVTATTGELFKAIGKTELLKKYSFIQLILLLIILFPLIKYYGIYGAAFSIVIPKMIIQGFAIAKICKFLKIKQIIYYKKIIMQLLLTIVLFLVSYIIKCYLVLNLISLILFILILSTIYLVIILLIRKNLIKDIQSL
jgi:O-antigen/teichoic acid export membrane protein